MTNTTRYHYTLLGGVLTLLIFITFLRSITPAPAADSYNEFIQAHKQFDEAFVQWTEEANRRLIAADAAGISPYSLDLQADIRVEWQKREVGEKFRKLERSVER